MDNNPSKAPAAAETQKQALRDSDPAAKVLFTKMFEQHFLRPGMGISTQTWDPMTGIRRQQQRRMAEGATAKERMRLFESIGGDREGMEKVFARAYTSPERAFMLVGKG